MKFAYKAKKGPEEIVEGIVDAASQDDAVTRIGQMGLVPILVEEAPDAVPQAPQEDTITIKANAPGQITSEKKIPKKHIYIFTNKLKTLLRSQQPLLNSLYFVENQIVNPAFKEVIRTITNLVKEGASFSDSLAKFPQHFSPLYINMIKAGEASGKLDNSLEQISKYQENERQLSQKVVSSLAYPSVMITVGFLTIIVIITFVIPKLRSLFDDFGDKLPLATKVLLGMSDFFSKYWILLFIFAIGGGIFIFNSRGSAWQKKILAIIKQKTPVIKDVLYNQALCRFSGGLSMLLSSGVSLLNSIRLSVPLIEDETAQEELKKACQEIAAGTALEKSLSDNCKYLPDMFVKMIAVGETSGKLDEILAELSKGYSEEVETTTKIVTSLIEPLAILVVGGILSFIVIAVLLPIFEMSMFVQ